MSADFDEITSLSHAPTQTHTLSLPHTLIYPTGYLLSKAATPGVSQPLLGLSEIGANVPRPPGVPPSVKLIDVMRADPLIR